MKIKVERLFVGDKPNVKIQVAEGGKWHDFGEMNFVERKELADQLRKMADQLRKMAEELLKVQS